MTIRNSHKHVSELQGQNITENLNGIFSYALGISRLHSHKNAL